MCRCAESAIIARWAESAIIARWAESAIIARCAESAIIKCRCAESAIIARWTESECVRCCAVSCAAGTILFGAGAAAVGRRVRGRVAGSVLSDDGRAAGLRAGAAGFFAGVAFRVVSRGGG